MLVCLITPYSETLRNRSIRNQISYIDEIMKNEFDDTLQKRFPEGKVFSNAIFSLAVIEFCEKNKNCTNKYAEIIDSNIKRILSKTALQPFNANMNPKYGIFYNGWTQFVLKNYQNSDLFKYSKIKYKVKNQYSIIEQRLLTEQYDSLRILDSYLGSNWPADNFIGLLTIEDENIREKWINKIFETSEHESGLVNHAGSQKGTIRGSSQAMITYCLNEVGYNKIEDYNKDFKNILVDEYLNIQLVKENEDGSNTMDVDSGPVVFGYGASATIMNIKAQASINNGKHKFTWAAMNTISCPINVLGKKYYLLKKEPMFDIFMLWGSVGLE